MPNADEIAIRRLTPDLLEDHLTFFRERAFADDPEWAGCYCFFPYHDPETTDFDSRTAEADREAITEAVETGYASGFLAYAGDQVVGWCNAAPRELYPQLSLLPGDGATTGATPCFIIDADWRGRGIATKLLQAAIEGMGAEGMGAEGMARMEAAPVAEPKTAADRHRGTVELYEAAGYEKVAELPSGTPLMEKKL
jgi:GNAT superfamily N-acetyltransferase